jgi:hypothetical protein
MFGPWERSGGGKMTRASSVGYLGMELNRGGFFRWGSLECAIFFQTARIGHAKMSGSLENQDDEQAPLTDYK